MYFQSVFLRGLYINENVAGRDGSPPDGAAKRLGLSVAEVERRIDSGEIHALIVKLRGGGRDIIIPESEIQRCGVDWEHREKMWAQEWHMAARR